MISEGGIIISHNLRPKSHRNLAGTDLQHAIMPRKEEGMNNGVGRQIARLFISETARIRLSMRC